MNARVFDGIAILLQASFYNSRSRNFAIFLSKMLQKYNLCRNFFKQVEVVTVVITHLWKRSDGIGLDKRHFRKFPSNIWIEVKQLLVTWFFVESKVNKKNWSKNLLNAWLFLERAIDSRTGLRLVCRRCTFHMCTYEACAYMQMVLDRLNSCRTTGVVDCLVGLCSFSVEWRNWCTG